ncbi:hypothetical protein EZS27_007203 [termite gut metagenome]|uniref:Uncharacterized protein n=1 Tax=termite gut metagenome TaxID=433724 RepID=A0A5J4SGN4_9ZZZZ
MLRFAVVRNIVFGRVVIRMIAYGIMLMLVVMQHLLVSNFYKVMHMMTVRDNRMYQQKGIYRKYQI